MFEFIKKLKRIQICAKYFFSLTITHNEMKFYLPFGWGV